MAGVAQPHIYRRFAWQAWADGTGWRAWTGLGAAVTPVTPRHFCVAGVALGDIHLDFTWQAWHNLTSTVVLRSRRGTDGTGWRAWTGLGAAVTPVTPRHFCVAGVALGDIYLDFTLAGVAQPHLCVAGVAQPHIHLRFAWQAWQNSRPPSFCVAGVAQTHIYRRFAWQAWHLATFTFVLCGRKSHLPSFCVADLTSTVVLRGRRGTDGTGWRAWTGLGAAVTPRHFCVAGVALGDIHLDFTWQAWHNLTSTVVLRGRRGTDGTGWRAWTGLGAAVTPVTPRHFCVAGVALGDIHLDFTWQGVAQPHIYRRFAWQAWDRWHWVARLDWFRRRRDACDAAPLLRGRRGTW